MIFREVAACEKLRGYNAFIYREDIDMCFRELTLGKIDNLIEFLFKFRLPNSSLQMLI